VGDDEAVIALFAERSEKERRAVAPELVRRYRDMTGTPFGSLGWDAIHPAYRDTMCTAFFACWSLAQIKRLRVEHRFGTMCNDFTLRALLDRRPTWATAWATWALDRQALPSGRAGGLWKLVRNLVRAGVCDPIDTEAYILGMIFGIDSPFYESRARWIRWPGTGVEGDEVAMGEWRASAEGRTVTSCLLDDPGLIEREIWRVFEVPGRPSRQLSEPLSLSAARGGGTGGKWVSAFVELVAMQRVSRGRVLSATLAALARDVGAHNSTFSMALWRALAPTAAERAARQTDLLHLLGHPSDKTPRFAVAELLVLYKDNQIDLVAFAVAVEGPIAVLPAATAKQALVLLERAAHAWPEPALTTVAAALLHSSASVRASAITVLRRHQPSVVGRTAIAVAAATGTLDPAEKQRLGLLGSVGPTSTMR
jgi:hypothetical protein